MSEKIDGDTVELIAVQGEVEANVIRGLLNSEGIISILKSDIVQGVTPFTVDGLGVVKIYVNRDDYDRARALIEDYRRRGKQEE